MYIVLDNCIQYKNTKSKTFLIYNLLYYTILNINSQNLLFTNFFCYVIICTKRSVYMNQILSTADGKSRGPLPIKSVIKFFAFSIIILGLILLGESAYSFYSNYQNEKTFSQATVPTVKFAQDGNNATISITHDKGIARVKYYWNDEEGTIVRGDSKTEVVISDVSIPAGTNVLNVEIVDDNSISSNISHDYTYEGIAINNFVVNNSSIKIVAEDVNGLNYLTYHWNSEEEIKVYPENEGDTSIEVLTEIPSGLNTLSITAVNSSNITISKEQQIKGNKRPDIDFYIDASDNNLYVTVTDEEGIDFITQKINDGEEEIIKADGKTKFTYNTPLDSTHITLLITATDVDGVSRTINAAS